MVTIRMKRDCSDVLLWVKAVPSASRDELAGPVGDWLKVRVRAAPEGGKANMAICTTLAKAFGVKPRDVTIESGSTKPEKIVRIANSSIDAITRILNV